MPTATLQDCVNTFLSQSHLKAGTRKAYKQSILPMCDYVGRSRPPHEVAPLELQKFWNHLTQRDYSDYTLRKHHRSLKTFWNWCTDMQLVTVNPFKGIKAPRIQNYNTRAKAMTDQEYHAMLNYARHSSPRNYALLLFLGDTGCRAIAASRLKVSDIDLYDQSATITSKGDKTRTVYYGEDCYHALSNWLRMKPPHSGEYLFRERVNNNNDTGPLKPDNISQIIRRVGHKAGIQRSLGSHSLRHRKGHQLADAGAPITVSAKVLGHASTETTQIYYPDDDARVRKTMNKLATKSLDKQTRKIIPLPKDKSS
jgi:site-specific recombinase XerD